MSQIPALGRTEQWESTKKEKKDEIDELRREIAALTEMVQRLQAPTTGSDDSKDIQPSFEIILVHRKAVEQIRNVLVQVGEQHRLPNFMEVSIQIIH